MPNFAARNNYSNMENKHISIRQILKNASSQVVNYGERLVLVNHVEQLELFCQPCRLDATVVLVSLGGEMEVSVNLRSYRIGADGVGVCLAGDVIQIHKAEAIEAYALLMSTDYRDELGIDFRQRSLFYMQLRRSAVVTLRHDDLKALWPYFPLMQSTLERRLSDMDEILRGLVSALSHCMMSLIAAAVPVDNRQQEDDAASRNQQLFDKFMALLRIHYADRHDVQFYADRLCLTPKYLSWAVKQYSGKSVAQWIDEYLILESRLLLKDSDLTIQEVAYRLNFATQSAFGKFFKSRIGIGPRAYRQKDNSSSEE